jgi:prepilin-type N-terminal cleavage/methylation domain-containing protein
MRMQMRKRGFSLVEIMVALTILMIIILGLANTTISFLHETTIDTVRVRAQSFADMRIAEVRGYPTYDNLIATFNNSDTPEAGFSRQTLVVRDKSAATACNNPPPGCPKNDVTRVTVTVTNAGLAAPISRTLAISSF